MILVGGIDLSRAMGHERGRDPVRRRPHTPHKRARVIPPVVLPLGLGLALGAVNGLGVAYLTEPAVVMTLAMNGIMEGLTLGLTKGLTCASCSSYAPGCSRTSTTKNVLEIPADLILWLGVAALASVVLALHDLRAQGSRDGNNPTAAFLARGEREASSL